MKKEEIPSGINNSKCIRECSGMSGSPCVTGLAFIESVSMSSYTNYNKRNTWFGLFSFFYDYILRV